MSIKVFRSWFLFLLFFGLSFFVKSQETCCCQNFYDYYEAEKMYYSGKFDTTTLCDKYKEVLINKNFGDISHLYNTMDKIIAIENLVLLKELILQVAKKGGTIQDINSFMERYPKIQKDVQLIDSTLFLNHALYYEGQLDSFYIKELIWMVERDQYVRGNDSLFNKYHAYIDSSNFTLLMNLVALNDDKLPGYTILGNEGYGAMTTLLIHMDIGDLSTLFPKIKEAIDQNELYDNEMLLYQIDRNHIGNENVYRVDLQTNKLFPFQKNRLLHQKAGFYQYYGGVELFDARSRRKIYWPFHPDVKYEIQQELYRFLCLPLENFGFPPSKLMPSKPNNTEQFLKLLNIE